MLTNVVNEIANETIPQSDTPRYLAISMVHKKAAMLVTTCETDNQLVFLKMDFIWFMLSQLIGIYYIFSYKFFLKNKS